MSGKKSSKLIREIVRPAKQLGELAHRSASRLYSPYVYDLTARKRVRVSRGALELKNNVAIYVVAPFSGIWPSHLQALNSIVGSDVAPVVVSNVPLSVQDKNDISDRAALVIERPNQGYDFGAFREGVLHLRDRIEELSRITLLNDSVWFPTPNSSDWFEDLETQNSLFTGATSNYGGSLKVPGSLEPEIWAYSPQAKNFHYQSYAVSFSERAIRDPAFLKFWATYPLTNNKGLTVRRGEIGLSQWAISQGWSTSSTYPIEQMDLLVETLSEPRLRKIAESLIVLGNPEFLALKHRVLKEKTDKECLRQLILAAARCLGVAYATPEFNLREMKFPFLKKSPVWHQKEASDITLRIVREHGDKWDILEEVEFLRRSLP